MFDLRNLDYEREDLFPNEMINHIVGKYDFLDYCAKTSFIKLYSNKYDFNHRHLFNKWLMCIEKEKQPIIKNLKNDNKFNKFISLLESMKFKNVDNIYLVYSENLMFDCKTINVRKPCVPKYMGFAASLDIGDSYFIFLDRGYFDNFTKIQQELIFLHEMGHKMILDNKLVPKDNCELESTCDKTAIISLSNAQGGKDIKKNISKNSTEFYNFLVTYGYCQNKAVKTKYKIYTMEELFEKNSENISTYNERINKLEKFVKEYGYGIQN